MLGSAQALLSSPAPHFLSLPCSFPPLPLLSVPHPLLPDLLPCSGVLSSAPSHLVAAREPAQGRPLLRVTLPWFTEVLHFLPASRELTPRFHAGGNRTCSISQVCLPLLVILVAVLLNSWISTCFLFKPASSLSSFPNSLLKLCICLSPRGHSLIVGLQSHLGHLCVPFCPWCLCPEACLRWTAWGMIESTICRSNLRPRVMSLPSEDFLVSAGGLELQPRVTVTSLQGLRLGAA